MISHVRHDWLKKSLFPQLVVLNEVLGLTLMQVSLKGNHTSQPMANKATSRSNDCSRHAEEIFKISPQIIHHFSHSLHTTRCQSSLARNTEKGNQFASYAQMVQYSNDSIPFFSLVYSSIAWNRKFSRSHSNHDWLRTSVISKGKDFSNRYLHGSGLNIHGGYGRHLTLSKWRYAYMHAQLVCSGLAHVCYHSILSLVEILFSVFLNLLSYTTFPPK